MAKFTIDTNYLKYLAKRCKQEYIYPVSIHYNKGVNDLLSRIIEHAESKNKEDDK